MRALILLLACALALALAPRAAAQADAFRQGVDAYRRGAYDEAAELWREALAAPMPDRDRARVLYDLGNAAWRAGRRGEALGWYAAALRLAPRDADARANLALAREELGLEPESAGDLGGTLLAAVDALTRAEAAWAVIAAALLFCAAQLGEALRGGRAWRALLCAAALALLACAAAWARAELRARADPYVAIGTPSVPLYSEPRAGLPAIASVPAGAEVRRIDALDAHVRVELADGTRGWARADELFRLRRDGG